MQFIEKNTEMWSLGTLKLKIESIKWHNQIFFFFYIYNWALQNETHHSFK